ncbi:hypothetical protein TNIN_298651 [Trichonephila inaurata madagascariensis]|uniref:Uncharacterized protein n=1 Tax=Trichonephila inaurata madagascariensis TaxID=2747483 RepID=A0A8X6Y932_9ARAC|nr:hypothetical protein TNIN_298651 [Trichonephila inaurata madagascariensis]
MSGIRKKMSKLCWKKSLGKMCRTQRSKQKNMAARRVNAIEENSENSENIYIGELKSVNELGTKETNCMWYEKILVNKKAVMFKLDIK